MSGETEPQNEQLLAIHNNKTGDDYTLLYGVLQRGAGGTLTSRSSGNQREIQRGLVLSPEDHLAYRADMANVSVVGGHSEVFNRYLAKEPYIEKGGVVFIVYKNKLHPIGRIVGVGGLEDVAGDVVIHEQEVIEAEAAAHKPRKEDVPVVNLTALAAEAKRNNS